MKKIILFVLFMVGTMTVNAQNYPLFFLGFVYTENVDSGEQEMIPFATIKLYDSNNPEKLVVTRISQLDGTYTIYGIDTKSTYIVEVIAPGYEKQKFVRSGGHNYKTGNINLPTCLENRNTDFNIKKTTYTLNLAPDQKKINIPELIKKYPIYMLMMITKFIQIMDQYVLWGMGMIPKKEVY